MARTLPLYGLSTTIPPFAFGTCFKLYKFFFIFFTYITSPNLKILSNSFFVQVKSSYFIIPCFLSSVSISIENFLIFLTIAKFQPIDFSNLYFFKFLFHWLEIFLFNIGPRQPFLLSYFSNPSLNDIVAIVWRSKFIGVLIVNPFL